MNIKIDLHTHTIASGHGYSTLSENITMAKERGLEILGLSEHAPTMPGGPHIFFLHNYKIIPREYGELRLMCGVEANIMDMKGGLDLDEATLKKMDYVIASLHSACVKPGTKEECTHAVIQAIRNPYVNIIGHPDDARYPLDYEAVVKEAKANHKLLEVNNSSVNPKSARVNGRENILTLLKICKKYDNPVLLGSDSHIHYGVGDFTAAFELLKETDFPEELVINTDVKKLEPYL